MSEDKNDWAGVFETGEGAGTGPDTRERRPTTAARGRGLTAAGRVEVQELLERAQAGTGGDPSRPNVRVVLLAAAVTIVMLGWMLATRRTPRSSSASYSSDALVLGGGQLGQEVFAPPERRKPIPELVEVAESAVPPTPEATPVARRARRATPAAVATPTPECEDCAARRAAAPPAPVTTPTMQFGGFASPTATPPRREKITVNLGTRIPIRLTFPVVTGPGAAPVTAEVTEAVMVRGQVAIPAQARVVGQGYASEVDDRVRVIVLAFIVDGVTVPSTGVVVTTDANMGIPGKLERKGSSQGKSFLGRVIAGAGRAATLGLVQGGVTGEIDDAMAASITEESVTQLNRWAADWQISDKVVRAPQDAPNLLVYLGADLALER